MLIGRREFCALLGATALAPGAFAADRQTVGFLDASGNRGSRLLVVGLLAADRIDEHERQIEVLRRQHGYARPLRYMSTDRNKESYAAAVIDHFASSGDLRFSALAAAGVPDVTAYERLIEQAGAQDFLLRMSGRPESRIVRERIGAEPFPARSNLAELAGFLTGCAYGEASGVRHPLKRGLVERLKAGTGKVTLTNVVA